MIHLQNYHQSPALIKELRHILRKRFYRLSKRCPALQAAIMEEKKLEEPIASIPTPPPKKSKKESAILESSHLNP
jgi:hypothetical protein